MSERLVSGIIAGFLIVAPLTCVASSEASLPDPTRPSSVSTEESSVSPVRRFQLDSILVGDQRRRAVINGISLAKGGQLRDATLVRIGMDRVLIEIDGQQYTLELDSAPSIRR
ncbi:MAG: Type II secretory pathway component [Halospina sp.]